jgi:hypothetical protein
MMVDFQLVAKVMLGVFILLGIVSLVMTIRVLTRKPEPNPTKLAATERSLLLSSWVLIPIVGNAINAIATQKYSLLLVCGLLLSYLLPLIVLYLKTRTALNKAASPSR